MTSLVTWDPSLVYPADESFTVSVVNDTHYGYLTLQISHPPEGEEKITGQQEVVVEEKAPLKDDPTYVPTRGGFYLHDDRFADSELEKSALK